MAAFGMGICSLSAVAQNAVPYSPSTPPPMSFHFGVPTQEQSKAAHGDMQILQPRSGTLAYAYNIPIPKGKAPDGNGYTPYLVLSHLLSTIGPNQSVQVQPSASTSRTPLLRFQALRNPGNERSLAVLYEPQFSPDGRYLLLKLGVPWSFDTTYELYVFDTVTRDLRQACTQEGNYELVSWSPDGNYIAFMAGGDAAGQVQAVHLSDVVYTGPIRLYVCEWRTGKVTQVASNDTLRGPFTWLAPHTLFYGMLPELEVSPTNQKSAKQAVTPRPNVYEYDVDLHASRLTLQDAYRPMAAPNGKWIAFYGSEHPDAPFILRDGWEDAPQGAALAVAHRNGSERVALNIEGGPYAFLQWLPTNLDETPKLLTVKQTRYGLNNEAEVREWNIATRHFRVVATLRAHDYEFSPRSVIEPQFLPLSLSSDGKTLLVQVVESFGPDPMYPPIGKMTFGVSLIRQSLQAVDLTSGRVSVITQVEGAHGLAWHEK